MKINKKSWQRTGIPNLQRKPASKIYYARFRVGRKQVWRSLETTVLSVAKLRLRDLEKIIRSAPNAAKAVDSGRFTFGQAMEIYRQRVETNGKRPNTQEFYLNGLKAVNRTWPALSSLAVNKVSRIDVEEWLNRLKQDGTGFLPPGARHTANKGNSPSTVRAALSALRGLIKIAHDKGALYGNPMEGLRGNSQRPKELKLPSLDQFCAILVAIRNAGAGRKSIDSRDLIAGLAYSGMRIGEARALTWANVDFENKRIAVPGVKSATSRRIIPLFPDLENLFREMRASRINEPAESKIFLVHESQKALNSACSKVGIKRITHHDLRHLFATQCIENDIDIPTISKWLGHADGGALAMKTYGHLRDEHSAKMALKVQFHPQNNL